MGQIMMLAEVLANIAQLDSENTIYVAEPWSSASETIVAREPEEGGMPEEVLGGSFCYFLEVSVAQEFIEDWLASSDEFPKSLEMCKRVIEYAYNDA